MKTQIRIGGRGEGKTSYLIQWLEKQEGSKALIIPSFQQKRLVENLVPVGSEIEVVIGFPIEKLKGQDWDYVGIDNLWYFDNPKKIIQTVQLQTDIMCTMGEHFDIGRIPPNDAKTGE